MISMLCYGTSLWNCVVLFCKISVTITLAKLSYFANISTYDGTVLNPLMSLAGGRLECSSLPLSATCTEREMSWPALSSQNSEHKARNTSLTYRKWIFDGELQRRRPTGQCLNKDHKVKVQRKMCQSPVLSCYFLGFFAELLNYVSRRWESVSSSLVSLETAMAMFQIVTMSQIWRNLIGWRLTHQRPPSLSWRCT